MYQKINGVYFFATFSAFYCSMGTSRIIQAGTRSYNKRITTVVSQEHVLICTTRKVTRPEHDMVIVLASKLPWMLCGWSNRRDFIVGDQSWLDISVGIIIDLILCESRTWPGLESGSKFTWFSCPGACKIDVCLEWGSILTYFCVGVGIDMVLVWRTKFDLFSVRVKIDLVLVCLSIIFSFGVSMEVEVGLVVAVQVDWISV